MTYLLLTRRRVKGKSTRINNTSESFRFEVLKSCSEQDIMYGEQGIMYVEQCTSARDIYRGALRQQRKRVYGPRGFSPMQRFTVTSSTQRNLCYDTSHHVVCTSVLMTTVAEKGQPVYAAGRSATTIRRPSKYPSSTVQVRLFSRLEFVRLSPFSVQYMLLTKTGYGLSA